MSISLPESVGYAPTVAERVAQSIIDGIRAGTLAPGQRLIEADLTRGLGVSRGPVREATRRLAAEGVLDVTPHRGVIVRKLSRADIADIYDVREALEGMAARLAAARIGLPGYRALALASAEGPACLPGTRSTNAYMEENGNFHETIVELAGNPIIKRQLGSLRLQMFRLQVRMVLNEETIVISATGHGDIMRAVLLGDGAAAETAMRRHINSSAAAVARMPDTSFGV